ncbi:hypothetical protein ERJ75_001674900 [Trypanosoma vivax]|uniref:Putative oxidoreductase n=1 Tax=Trypanosoma vivax (strain Y486) TaxID=1055687 RepID=G0TZI5_TRYVY|nr:hypothetical protein ERJ75_001674900 [Trypanosoma vivax]CCC49391.1 putative oxidoreductase [Trypanosoma vivax Y486]
MPNFSSIGWRYARCGPLVNVLKKEAFDIVPSNDHVVVEVLRAPLHRVDTAVINGTVLGRNRLQLSAFPRVGGSEGVGRVVATGGVKTLKQGDTVWVAPLNGTWATRIAVHHSMVHKIDPKYVLLAVSASNFLVAQHLLNGFVQLQKGQVVLQNGGSSVTSLAVSAIAKSIGVKVLTVSTPGERFNDSKKRHAEYGSEVFECNGSGARAVRHVLGNAGVALYLNATGGRHFDTFLGFVGSRGHVVSYGAQSGSGLMMSGSNFIFNEITMNGLFLPSYIKSLSYNVRQTQLEFVLQRLYSMGFSYPTTVAASLEDMPGVWDCVFVHGGTKGVVIPNKE